MAKRKTFKVIDATERIAQGNFITPSPDDIRAAENGNGGWSAAQLAEWGIRWPPKAGWRELLERRWHRLHSGDPLPEKEQAPRRQSIAVASMRPQGTTIACPTCAHLFKTREARDQHVRTTHENPSWVASKGKPKAKVAPICPTCGKPALITATQYGPRADCCGLRSWALKPLVTPGTMAARKLAHATFDPVWQSDKLSRGEAYRRLALAMEMSTTECHISIMTEDQANRVVEAVRSGALREDDKRIAA